MTTSNREQTEHWKNRDQVGHWIDQQARHDEMLSPFVDIIFGGAQLHANDSVLDVGCGCGTTTIAAARVSAPALASGVDLSEPMLARARQAATAEGVDNAAFDQADAQTHPFDAHTFDAVISRFGIMFFDDPITAFTNLHRAARPDGRLAFVCWQPLTANEWLLLPGAALAEHVPLPDLGKPGAPGMLAFADPDQPKRVLEHAGWHDIAATDTHASILVGGRGTVDDAVDFLRTGSLGRSMLAGVEPDTEARAIASVRATLAPHHDGDGVRLDAAVWLVTARA